MFRGLNIGMLILTFMFLFHVGQIPPPLQTYLRRLVEKKVKITTRIEDGELSQFLDRFRLQVRCEPDINSPSAAITSSYEKFSIQRVSKLNNLYKH